MRAPHSRDRLPATGIRIHEFETGVGRVTARFLWTQRRGLQTLPVESRGDPDLGATNEGVTIVWLK